MRTGFKQPVGILSISTPFGDDDLLLDAIEGYEGISELFCFQLHMRSPVSNLAADTIVGKSVTVTLQAEGAESREITGIVSRFSQSGFDRDFASYQAELVPDVWLLKLSRDRKIYQNKSVPDVLTEVLTAFGIAIEDKLSASYEPIEYIVQYDETAYDFISRLMGNAGIFFFFSFSNSEQKIVLADDASAFESCVGADTVRFAPMTGQENPLDTVVSFNYENSVKLKTVTVSDYDFTSPTTSLEGSYEQASGAGESLAPGTLTQRLLRQLPNFAQRLVGSARPCCAVTALHTRLCRVPNLH